MAPYRRLGTRWRAAYGPHNPAAQGGSLSPPCPAVVAPATLDLLNISKSYLEDVDMICVGMCRYSNINVCRFQIFRSGLDREIADFW